METTRKTTAKKTSIPIRDRVVKSYKESVLSTGKRPVSVFSFCLESGIKEEDFYAHFGSFQGVERAIWKGIMGNTISRLSRDKAFGGFSAREKILALYFTLLEELTRERSYIVYQLDTASKLDIVPPFMRDFKESYEGFVGTIVSEGQEVGEIARRPYLDKRYPQLFWMHLVLLLQFWKNDDSPSFEKTDAYVEKSVRLAFDLIGKGVLDSAVDFARFVIQTKLK